MNGRNPQMPDAAQPAGMVVLPAIQHISAEYRPKRDNGAYRSG